MKNSIILAERKITIEEKDGSKKNILIQLGKPYWIMENEEAACPIAIKGLYDKLADIHGADFYQAIELAIQFVNILLKDITYSENPENLGTGY